MCDIRLLTRRSALQTRSKPIITEKKKKKKAPFETYGTTAAPMALLPATMVAAPFPIPS
jgi:hypothetical protein